jgi:anti-sigma regulatory factor (Ser/Thr protein kinase)
VVARDGLIATAAYQPEPEAVGAARRFVRATLQSWQRSGYCRGQAELVDDAVLLTSELVTNAVLHAGTTVQVTCRLTAGAVEIVVVDHRPLPPLPDEPQRARNPSDQTGGRGLLLPAELASSWGVTYAGTAKAVWFRMGGTVPRQGAGGLGPPLALVSGGEPAASAAGW